MGWNGINYRVLVSPPLKKIQSVIAQLQSTRQVGQTQLIGEIGNGFSETTFEQVQLEVC